MRLTDLRELELPPTTVAEGAWARARGRRRRRATATVVAAMALVGAVGAAATVRGGDAVRPAPAPATSPATRPATSEPATQVVTELPDFAALAGSAPALDPHDVVALSADPVTRAVLAVSTDPADIEVLGDDGRWRDVDVAGLGPTRDRGGYEGNALQPTGLSADGTRLALPQPDRVLVVDLTTGTSRGYDVPGYNQAVVWADDDTLVVTAEGATKGRTLDVADGRVEPSSYTATTGFAPDGTWVTWGRSGTLESGDGTRVVADAANDGGLTLNAPLVDDAVAVGLGTHELVTDDMRYPGLRGAAVVDRRTGDLRGFLYTEGPDSGLVAAHLLGLDGDTVTLAAGVPPAQERLVVVRWAWRTGEVTPVATVPAGALSGSLP